MSSDHSSSLGEFLRQERERRGITIEQVASATKISVRMLHSLESDRYSELPAKPFIRGFVTSYSKFIGLDSKELLTRFGDFIEGKAHDRPTRDAGHSGYAFDKREGEQSRTILWVVMGSFILLGAIVMLVLKPSLKHHHHSQTEKLKAVHVKVSGSPLPEETANPKEGGNVVAPVSEPKASTTPTPELPQGRSEPVSLVPLVLAPSPLPTHSVEAPKEKDKEKEVAEEKAVPEKSPSPNPEPSSGKPDKLRSGADLSSSEVKHKAVVQALGDVWVRFQVDNKPLNTIILRKDRKLVLKAREMIKVQVSDPSEASINYNGHLSKTFKSEKKAAVRQGNSTLIFPLEDMEKIQEPFPGEKKLPSQVPQSPRDASSKTSENE